MHTINIIGLGSSDIDNMPLGVWRFLTECDTLYMRTMDHPAVQALETEGLNITSFDDVYEESDTFSETYKKIVDVLMTEVRNKDVNYVVPGHPLFYETTTELLLEKEQAGEVKVNLIGGGSFIDVVINALKVPVNEGFQLLDATLLEYSDLNHHQHTLITQVYDQISLSEAKLTLLELYPADTKVKLADSAGSADEKIYEMPLHELDHLNIVSNRLTLYIPKVADEGLDHRNIHHMTALFDRLVGEDGCPWDKVQTHQSIEKNLIEETYEVIEAIEREDDDAVVEELGDILLQVALHSAIANKDGYFDFYDVLKSLNDKIVRRHPHVFGDAEVNDMDDLSRVWKAAKASEGKKEKVKYEKEYGEKVLKWMHETIHHQVPLSELTEEKREKE
ncbi:MazG nucleotide pyrophosphohydrolase domain-containing protein [Corticicoccus populi]|uniref:MazG nucleotide pyrophosphohydrolase domain-containing protein n=1 Tax=Corticicoccus populi TaxID=1812821 RepID=A0ABW5WXR0_9STAP